jgi:hypothetical protein
MKKMVALMSLILIVLFISGCVGSDACKQLEEEMAARNISCRCSSSDTGNLFPDEAENATEGEKCYCICIEDGVSVKAITPKPSEEAPENP